MVLSRGNFLRQDDGKIKTIDNIMKNIQMAKVSVKVVMKMISSLMIFLYALRAFIFYIKKLSKYLIYLI